MKALSGKISDRIQSGEIVAGKTHREQEMPSASAVRGACGHSCGKGATTRGGNAQAE